MQQKAEDEKFCEGCGALMKKSAVFCTRCGSQTSLHVSASTTDDSKYIPNVRCKHCQGPLRDISFETTAGVVKSKIVWGGISVCVLFGVLHFVEGAFIRGIFFIAAAIAWTGYIQRKVWICDQCNRKQTGQ